MELRRYRLRHGCSNDLQYGLDSGGAFRDGDFFLRRELDEFLFGEVVEGVQLSVDPLKLGRPW